MYGIFQLYCRNGYNSSKESQYLFQVFRKIHETLSTFNLTNFWTKQFIIIISQNFFMLVKNQPKMRLFE